MKAPSGTRCTILLEPDSIIATHETDDVVDSERPLCTYPQQAHYIGPAGGADEPANWVATNFECRLR